MIVVADATPVNILVRIGAAEVLQQLFHCILVPPGVLAELSDPRSPEALRAWIAAHPEWLCVEAPTAALPEDGRLGQGEREAIALAIERSADLLLVDDRRARQEAKRRGLSIVGTIGVLRIGAQRGLIRGPDAAERLRASDFWVKDSDLDILLGELRGGDW